MPKHALLALLLGTIILAGTVACTRKVAESTYETAPDAAVGIDESAMDPAVRPGDDFYEYANGGWMQRTVIPADRSSTGAFYEARQEVEKRVAGLVNEIVNSSKEPGTDPARIAAFYSAYLDTAAIDAAGLEPVRADLDRFEAISDKRELSEVLGSNLRADVDPLNTADYFTENLFGIFVTQGLATRGDVLPYILQGGLGLPEREYYLSADPNMVEIRKAYRGSIENMLRLARIPDAGAKADRIFALETKIAEAHASREDSVNFAKGTTVWTRQELESSAPGIDWPAFLAAAQLGEQDRFDAYNAGAIIGLSALVASESLQAWKDWLVFHRINAYADVLPASIDDAHFAFNERTLSGTPRQQSREKRALKALNTYLGDAVGRAYVAKYFPASYKAQLSAMVDNIKEAFRKRVSAIDWLAPDTRSEALAKVDSIRVGVGYPDTWRDYSSLQIDAEHAYADVRAAEEFEYEYQLAKIGKPMDRDEWWMTPQTVNAVNLPVQNALNFPAGILQRPFFDPEAGPAYNYGAIGAVIGHEISHSFDNNGAAFDSDGVYRNWWTKQDLARFVEQGNALAKQYDAYAPFPDLHVNGKLTLGENIADLAGVAAALDAYHASLQGHEAPVIDGFTGDQRFFIAFAQIWASKFRDPAMRKRIATNGHAPGMYRALTVRNLDSWYAAFEVRTGDKLYLAPEQRVTIW
jgi:endothelin-converting enzyme/putative endopeptidase